MDYVRDGKKEQRAALYFTMFDIVHSTLDPSNGQTANFMLKPPKVIESRTYANLECY